MLESSVILAVLGLLLLALAALVILGTIYRTRWGVNFSRVSCPSCGRAAPIVRKPASLSQALWGGWSCPCGTEIDKWGHAVAKH